jgi:hypothetical protein
MELGEILSKRKKKLSSCWWLRKIHTFSSTHRIYKKRFLKLPIPIWKSIKRKGNLINDGLFDEKMYATVESITYIPNNAYDKLLSEIFLSLTYTIPAPIIRGRVYRRNTPYWLIQSNRFMNIWAANIHLFFFLKKR